VTARLLCSVLVAALLGCHKAPVAGARADGPALQMKQREVPSDKASAGAAATGQLARVRPPAAPCLSRKNPTPTQLADRAEDAYEAGDHARALSCAEEAIRADPRFVPALHVRATALAALGREGEARLGFARALSVDPDDPETLLGAADFYVARTSGERDALLLGLEYALRGARIATRKNDAELAGRLLGVAAMAENDLGRSRDALQHADQALRAAPRDASLHYERGVALYELVRFAEARVALEKALSIEPDEPWTLHYLALVAEHEGDEARAQKLESKARTRAPRDFRGIALSRPEFDAELKRAIELLPAHERRALSTVPLEVDDVPSLVDLTAVDPPLSPAILGLFRGPSETETCDAETPSPCRSIALYWKNLARFARDRQELAEQVRVTLLHELGHLHGESDDELRDRGLE
jgi:Flp pilus assembly protein TadD/predicted Zn-dependent protease with MMP-like domain